MKERPFRIVIVGGGIAGLTLAIMLEKLDLDFVLLEAHEEIAPPVGASIGLMPNGLLVLDQIGCYEPVKAVSQNAAVENSHVRSPEGRSLACTKDMIGQMEIRHGYPMLFFDRQWLLQVLYDQIKQKDRIILRSRIEIIEHIGECVQVRTTDQKTYKGNMVIGADGIHSAVRREMRRLADEEHPGRFPSGEEDRVPCYYQCSFGIAQNVDNWSDGDQAFTAGLGQSFLVVSGPQRRCYWFLFKRLPEVKYGKDIPRYNTEDEAHFIEENAHLPITETLTFGQLYAKRITSTLTPLHEVVFEKWFYGRIVLIGDSAHKPNPINGMGGNGAIESAAELVNAILRLKQRRQHGLDGLSTTDVEAVSREMQDARYERAKAVVTNAHRLQALYASEKPLISNLIWNVVLPLTGGGIPLDMLALGLVGSARLEGLPVPRRRRIIPFNHELPAKPLKSRSLTKSMQAVLVVAMSITLFASTKAPRAPSSRMEHWAGLTGRTQMWFNNTTVTHGLIQSTAVHYPDTRSGIYELYALSQLVSPMLIYMIEGYRVGNQGTLLSLPSLFLFGIQFQGVGRIAPLYAILSAFQASHSPAGRFVRPDVAKALIPALTLSYLSLAIVTSISAGNNPMDWVALCHYIPLVFSLVLTLLLSACKIWQRRKWLRRLNAVPFMFSDIKTEKQEPSRQSRGLHFDRYNDADVAILRQVYYLAFAVQAAIHVATLADAYSHANVSPASVFERMLNPGQTNGGLQTLPLRMPDFFQNDLALGLVGHFGLGLFLIWELRRLGYTPTMNAARSTAALLVCQVILGPGAASAALWSWREDVISSMSTLSN